MTEQEWLNCTDPKPMLDFLRGKASNRKLRLFACGCCRPGWRSISEVFQEAIRVAENHADGRATDVELGAAVRSAHRVRRKRNFLERAVYDAARSAGDALGVAHNVARAFAFEAAPNPSPTHISRVVDDQFVMEEVPPNAARLAWNTAYASFLRLESSFLRDIFGSLPFCPLLLDPTWRTPTVVELAQAIYDNRAFDRMPELADALQAAGCDNDEILSHCRGPGLHVRGCWVVDLVLGKA